MVKSNELLKLKNDLEKIRELIQDAKNKLVELSHQKKLIKSQMLNIPKFNMKKEMENMAEKSKAMKAIVKKHKKESPKIDMKKEMENIAEKSKAMKAIVKKHKKELPKFDMEKEMENIAEKSKAMKAIVKKHKKELPKFDTKREPPTKYKASKVSETLQQTINKMRDIVFNPNLMHKVKNNIFMRFDINNLKNMEEPGQNGNYYIYITDNDYKELLKGDYFGHKLREIEILKKTAKDIDEEDADEDEITLTDVKIREKKIQDMVNYYYLILKFPSKIKINLINFLEKNIMATMTEDQFKALLWF